MGRRTLVDDLVDGLLDDILNGKLKPHDAIPPEADIAKAYEVSRLTVREALKALRAQNILYVKAGRGTFVNPLNRWASLEAVLRAASEGKNEAEASVQLIELRRMLETGACELAAGRISDAGIQTLFGHVAAMRAAHEVNDVAAFVEADLAFHDLILHASENVFVAVLFEPLHRVLEKRRTETSAVPQIQEHAIGHHQNIAEALESRDAARSREAMDAHMQQTLDDLKNLVLEAKPQPV